MNFIPSELIKKKKLGGEHTAGEIQWLISEYSRGVVPDYQMAAWAMAVWFNGMSEDEIATLTLAMRDSGSKFNFKNLARPRIDKHSTGGVGDKTTLIIGPILAAAGVAVPMIAGRGLGHTGGTIDKLHSLPGFRLDLNRNEFERFVAEFNFALIGQTADICPADKKFYALRDVTATIDSLPLICGSIMSKKLAEDLTGLVLDVKFGTGAFMKTVEDAVTLARLLKATGEKNGVRVSALITNMNEPLGRFVGNSVEVFECAEIMAGRSHVLHGVDYYARPRELSLSLAGHMLFLAEKVRSPEDGYALAQNILNSGAALREFKNLLQRQGPAHLSELPVAHYSQDIVAKNSGRIVSMNTELLGLAAVELGAGRKTATDNIDYTAGIEICCQLGDVLEPGQRLYRIFANSPANFAAAEELIHAALTIDANRNITIEILPLIVQVIP